MDQPKLDALYALDHPAYAADVSAIKANLDVARRIKDATGCQIILATKAFAMPALFPLFEAVLDGTTASGLYEARLGAEHFDGAVHAFAPAFTDDDIAALRPICQHISFNSIAQFERYHSAFTYPGLRLHPHLSQTLTNPIYDPSAPHSRFGVEREALTADILARLTTLHVHNLCENMADASAALIYHLMEYVPEALDAVTYLNLGGGHYITHADYNVTVLIEAVGAIQSRHQLTVILEPGGALVYEAGYLVAQVLDVIERGGQAMAILNVSATCHMPDVLEVPYRPNVIGDDTSYPHHYVLAGNTCLTGDVIGSYQFAAPLTIGDTVIFTDMMQYSFVKNTTFNGMPLPDLGILHEDGTYEGVKRFGYEAFKEKLG